MKNSFSKNATLVGAGAGLVLFVMFGLLPGSLLGGAAGLKFAGLFFSLPLEQGIISRAIVLASMLLGVMVSGIIIVTATSSTAWIASKMISVSAQDKASEAA